MVYFVRIKNPRTGEYYTSYNDYFRLVKLSGFHSCDLDQVNPYSGDTYIVTLNYDGPDQKPIPDSFFPEGRTSSMILHQLERFNIIDERFDQIWLYDRSMPELSHPKAKYVILGGHKDFMIPVDACKTYDFSHMCYPYPRRAPMLHSLIMKGYSIAPAPEVFFDKNVLLQSSRAGLALHQHQHSLDLIEPIRLTVYSCMKLPILAEHSKDFYPYKVYSFEDFLSGSLELDSITDWQRNWDTFTRTFTFKSEIERALCASA